MTADEIKKALRLKKALREACSTRCSRPADRIRMTDSYDLIAIGAGPAGESADGAGVVLRPSLARSSRGTGRAAP